MLGLGSLSFAVPWLLAALIALPVIWWLLRVTPPSPRRERFPAIAFLFGTKTEETPAHTPLWLLILRMLIAALVILAFAGPILNAKPALLPPGPLTLVIDNGWTSAKNWDRIKASALSLIDDAARAGHAVALIKTAPAAAQSFAPQAPARAKAVMTAMTPEPWLPTRADVLKAWKAAPDAPKSGRLVWLSDGIAGSDGKAFALALETMRKLDVLVPPAADLPLAIRPVQSLADEMKTTLIRSSTGTRQEGTVTAYASGARVVARGNFAFEVQGASTAVHFRLPLEIRNKIERIEIDGGKSAGAVTLLDDRWHRRAVGLVSGGSIESAQPLLGDLYYVERALEPYADLRKGDIGKLIDEHVSVLVLADVGHILDDDARKISAWLDSGGVLIRFAGPRLAQQADALVPTPLRTGGGRVLGGALSWNEPQKLAPFPASSPFFGLAVPDDITVRRQVLAEPSLELASHTWARLQDGTPLVTALQHGKGHIVLFHVTANSDWSNLPLSGLFVDMLQRVIDLSLNAGTPSTNGTTNTATLSPREALDGFGALRPAPASAEPVSLADLATLRPAPNHPPGFYGPADAPRALNTTRSNETLLSLTDVPSGASLNVYAADRVVQLGPSLLVAAIILALIDGLAALALMGKLSWLSRAARAPVARNAALLIAISALTFFKLPAARADDAALIDAALHTHLAYIVTGNPSVDAMSRAGLDGLTERLTAKTALEPDKPVGLDIERDQITLFPLIYWPVTAQQQPLSAEAQRKLEQYLKTGGMILFDTRDQDIAATMPNGQTPAAAALQKLLQGLDIPALEPVPPSHVLTRSFYLLNDFPGRFEGGKVWVETTGEGPDSEVETREGAVNDGVSSVIIGSNDWSSAWAVDSGGRWIAPVIPGGQMPGCTCDQREAAYRFGINLAMYALTGNYKGDEVHTRELIKRLGE